MESLKKTLFLLLLLFFMAALASVASADTVAYWRFDDQGDPDIDFSEGLASAVARGNPLPDINAIEGWNSGLWRKAVHDWSGNNNHLTTWDWPWAGWMWASEFPSGIVPKTGELNTLSMAHLSGCCPACFTWSEYNLEPKLIDIEDIQPLQWTIEASFYLTDTLDFRTIIGRDAASVNPEDTGRSALYFQIVPDGNVSCKFTDVNGLFHQVFSEPDLIEQNRWYNMAAVSDGSTLSLYLEDCEAGAGMLQVGSLDLTASGSNDTRLTNGKSSTEPNGADWHAGTWTVGRGLYGGGHTDRWFGYIDEVRISNEALDPSQFLFYPGPSRSYARHPIDGTIETSTDIDLWWTSPVWVDTHDVYFGENYDDVTDANRSNHSQPGLIYYDDNYDPNIYPLTSLEPGKYYWRVDDVNDGTVIKGTVLDFVVASKELSVLPIHRYSFIDGDTVAVDDVGGEDGTFQGTATLVDNQLSLDGSGAVYLPSDILDPGLTSVTIEAWFSIDSWNNWQRVFDFGETADSGEFIGAGGNCLFYTPTSGDGTSRFCIATLGVPSWQTGEIRADGPGVTDYGSPVHIACVYDGTVPEIRLYQNSVLISTTAVTGGHSLAGVTRDNAYIGDSSYEGDPYLLGVVEEFRIYDVNLTEDEIVNSYTAGPDVYRATNPNPPHGSFTSNNLTLIWDVGAKAEVHDIYIDPNKSKVVDANKTNDPGLLVHEPDWASNSYALSNLTPEETYYWRIDEVNDTNIWRGNIWSFSVSPLKASEPSPYNGKICVFNDPCTVLSWNRGHDANQSELYFGMSPGTLNYVDTITHDGNERYSYTIAEGLNKLDFETDYYWQIIEVNGVNEWEGDIWHFTTIPVISPPGGGLVGWWTFDEGQDNAIDWSGNGNHGIIYGGAQSVEGYAESAEGYEEGAIQLDGDDDYVQLPIGDIIETLDSMTVATWINFDDSGTWWQRIFDFGFRDVNDEGDGYIFLTPRGNPGGVLRCAISLSNWAGESVVAAPYALPTGWHHVAVTINGSTKEMELFIDGSSVGFVYTNVIPSELGNTANNWLGESQYAVDALFTGLLDDFRIYDFAMTEEEIQQVAASKEASDPEPANFETHVDRNPVLSWKPGKYAASVNGHELYYGTEFNDVNERVGDPVVLTNPTYTIPAPNAPYESGTVVYWVVNEVNEDANWPGNVWQFTIKDYSVIDDFYLYSDTGRATRPDVAPEGTLRNVWVDGYDAFEYGGTGSSGSFVQLNTDTNDCYYLYVPCEHYIADENGIYISEGQSMKFYYDNDGTVEWQDTLYGEWETEYIYTPSPNPYLSEAYAAINDDNQPDPDLGSLDLLSDWSGYKVLRIPFYGDPNNAEEGMYVRLEDGDGTIATIKHPGPLSLKNPWWEDWYIALNEFNLDLSDIGKIYLGIGDPCNPQAGGSGMVFFDDIELLTEGVCVEDANCDLNGDCVADNADLELLTMAIPWYGVKPVSLPTPIIDLKASQIGGSDGDPVASWTNTDGSMHGTFDVNDNISDGNRPVLETIDSKKAVTFADIGDLLIWDQCMPGTVTGANDFTVVIEAFNISIGDEEWILSWSERSPPAGTFAAFGYGTNVDFGAAAHYYDPDMGFGVLGAPSAHTWHTIGYTYDGSAENIVVDGLVYNSEAKVLAVEPNQPVVIGTAYGPAETAGEGSLEGDWDPVWANPDLRFTGSVASIKVYDESIPGADLALWMGGAADFDHDDRIDFRDVAVLGNNWLMKGDLYGD